MTIAADLYKLLEGRKTYVVAALGILYLFGGDQGWWHVSAEVLGLLNLLGLAALRAGVAKTLPPPGDPEGKPQMDADGRRS